MIIYAGRKLITYLRRHETVGDAVTLKILIEGNEVKAEFLRYDMHTGTRGKRWVEVHHAGIKAVAGIGGDSMFWTQVVITTIPIAEGYQIGMYQLTAFGYARRTRGIEEDEKR